MTGEWGSRFASHVVSSKFVETTVKNKLFGKVEIPKIEAYELRVLLYSGMSIYQNSI